MHWIPRSTPFLFIICILTAICRPCLAATPLVIGAADSYPLVGATVEVLEDPGRRLTIEDVVSPRYHYKKEQKGGRRRGVRLFAVIDIDRGEEFQYRRHDTRPWGSSDELR
ncbi:hypothetical protein [Geobacter sp. SVR]|uniref:hypothetical protein n=1 Tax=Geobacter sp. SVR TaxID=2495594 RepID=UPI00143F0337|nr:hypothetical protein [Geobacter sp. SVR]BCS55105.1 hypothetical protein GSVR_34130 [Geobacter sp. SVR]GCF85286.1 hypothetical protein GSbR_18860 [Geobacter sp. SVR]